MDRHLKFHHLLTWIIPGILLLSACSGGSASGPTATPEAEYNVTPIVSATGEVIPVEWATLSMNASGVAAAVLVKEGERVQKGQALVRLTGRDRLVAQVTAAELAILQANQGIKTLYDNVEQDRAAAQLSLAEAKKALDRAEKRKLNPAYSLGNRNQIDTAYANYVLAQEEVDRLEDEWSWVQDRAEDDTERASVLSQLAAVRTERDKARANLNYLTNLPDPLEVSLTDATVTQAQAAVDTAQRELDRLKEGPNPDTLKLAETALKNAQDQLKAAQTALDDLELRAPFDGTVTRVYLRAQESVVAAAPVIEMANLAQLRVETTDLSEIDVARVDIGSPVSITFDAVPDMVVSGKVILISPRAAEGSGVNYKVTIELDEIPDNLRWGMTAFADIEVSR